MSPITFDDGPVARRIGLVLLATDRTTERDFARMIPANEVTVHASRIAYENPTTVENLRAMGPRLTEGATLILPGEKLDAICYACTSASTVLGDETVTAALAAGAPGAPVVTPPLAARKALAALGASRISILTPYIDATAAPVAAYFADHGFAVAMLTNLGLDDDRVIARVTLASIVTAAREAVASGSEALFISCTALRAAEVAGEIEAAVGCPVVTSNQAAAWMCLRLAGCDAPIAAHGRVVTLGLPQ